MAYVRGVGVEVLERRRLLTGTLSGTVYEDTNADGAFEPAAGDFPIGGVIVYHDANNNGQFEPGLADRFAPAAELPKAIRDARTVESRIVVEGLPGTVRDVNVTVDIEHPNTFDLEATLVSPTGKTVRLFRDVGGGLFGSENFDNTILDDEAADFIHNGEPPFTGPYAPQQPLSTVDGDPMNGTWTLRVTDSVDNFAEGSLLDWGLTFDLGTAEPNTQSDSEGHYTLELAPGTVRLRQVLFPSYRQTEPAANGAYVVTLADGQAVTGRDFGATTAGAPAASVVARHVFYNRSAYDGRDAAADARDDDAIAPDKRALEPGMAASFDNYTSYTRGINGVMVDVTNLPAGGGLSAADFTFHVGNTADVGSWQQLSVAPAVSVRRGEGFNGADRVTLTWPDATIVRQWLRVSVNPTAATGLAAADVFYFGNLPGEIGDQPAAARVTANDALRVRSDYGSVTAIDHPFDFNRDGRVNVSDYAAARANIGASLHHLSLLPGAAVAAAPATPFSATRITPRAAYRPTQLLHDPSDPLA